MREAEKDSLRLTHIIEAIDNIEELTQNLDLDSLPEKDLRYFGLVKLLEIIGEASFMLTKEFKENHRETPWNEIIKMRHILVHGYYTVNPIFIKSTIKENLRPLKEQIISYLNG